MIIRRCLFVIICLWTVAIASSGQEATPETTDEPIQFNNSLADTIRAEFLTESRSPLVGEPFEIRLIVDIPPEARLIEWPTLTEEWGDFDLSQVGEVQEEILDNGTVRYTQDFIGRLWRPGDFATPETFVRYQIDNVGEIYGIPVTTTFFTVPSVLESNDINELTMRPYTPPYRVLYVPPWVILVSIAIGIVAIWRVWWWYIHREVKVAQSPAKLYKNPEDSALLTLESIANRADLTPQDKFLNGANALRTYLHARFAINAPKMTTQETIQSLKSDPMWEGKQSDTYANDLEQLLRQADMVKFADIRIDNKAATRMIELAQKWVGMVRLMTQRDTEAEDK